MRGEIAVPPRILKEKHIKLKLTPGGAAFTSRVAGHGDSSRELSEAAILAVPRCTPDGAATPRSELRAAQENRGVATNPGGWQKSVTYEALGWHMAERLQRSPLLAGDAVDIAFTIGHNDHPEYGGLELSLRDFRTGAGLAD